MARSVAKRIIEGLTDLATSLERGDDLNESFTCRKVSLNLEPTSYTPNLVKKTRKLLGASQTVFAMFLGVSPQTVRAWEQGKNVPNDIACRFMDEIRHDLEYWKKRMAALFSPKSIGKTKSASNKCNN